MNQRIISKLTKALYKSGAMLMATVMLVSIFAFALVAPVTVAVAEEPLTSGEVALRNIQASEFAKNPRFPQSDTSRPGFFPQYTYNPYGPLVTDIGTPSNTGPALINREVGSAFIVVTARQYQRRWLVLETGHEPSSFQI